jgi:hypothetical protein
MIAPRLVQAAWHWTSLPRARALRRALSDPAAAQHRILRSYLARHGDTAFGRAHGFDAIQSAADFQKAVPLRRYDEYVPWIDRIRAGEPGVLTADPVERLVPSSGSTAAVKLIPYTAQLRAEFARGLAAWIADVFTRFPKARCGRAYWSISPMASFAPRPPSAVPIGFEDDASYVGGAFRRAVQATLAMRPEVAALRDIASFRYATALELLRAPDLALISIWHPSFLSLLLESATAHWESLVADVRSGGATGALSAESSAVFEARPQPRRGAQLAEIGPGRFAAVWPRLALLSCWADAHAAEPAARLARAFPGVPLQPKGLLATEAFMTLPLAHGGQEGWPLALTSHFFELLDDAERPRLAHEVRAGDECALVVTTGGGLYRYRMQDRVRVVGFVGRTPSLRFLGKEDSVSDRVGEKLDERFVSAVLHGALSTAGDIRFSMLAPDYRDHKLGYTLYIEGATPDVATRLAAMESELAKNPHYRYARELGQLAPLRAFLIERGGDAVYMQRRSERGQRLGDIKPAALCNEAGWSARFEGRYADER